MFKSKMLHLIKQGGQHLVTFKVSEFFSFNIIQVGPYFTLSGHSSLLHVSVTMWRSPGHYLGQHTHIHICKHTQRHCLAARLISSH